MICECHHTQQRTVRRRFTSIEGDIGGPPCRNATMHESVTGVNRKPRPGQQTIAAVTAHFMWLAVNELAAQLAWWMPKAETVSKGSGVESRPLALQLATTAADAERMSALDPDRSFDHMARAFAIRSQIEVEVQWKERSSSVGDRLLRLDSTATIAALRVSGRWDNTYRQRRLAARSFGGAAEHVITGPLDPACLVSYLILDHESEYTLDGAKKLGTRKRVECARVVSTFNGASLGYDEQYADGSVHRGCAVFTAVAQAIDFEWRGKGWAITARKRAGSYEISISGTQQYTIGDGQRKTIKVTGAAGVPVGTIDLANTAAPIGVLMNAPNAEGLAGVQMSRWSGSNANPIEDIRAEIERIRSLPRLPLTLEPWMTGELRYRPPSKTPRQHVNRARARRKKRGRS